MSSAKYDLLASKISHFDAVEMRQNESVKKNRANCMRCVVIGIVVALLVAAALILVAVVIVESVKHNKSKDNPTPSPPECPVDVPEIPVPCSTANTYTETSCPSDCCWYAGISQCLLNYPLSCNADTNNMFNCLPENDNWNASYARSMCNARGCCWGNNAGFTSGSKVPFNCYYPLEYGYLVQSSKDTESDNGKLASIVRRSPQPSMYSDDKDVLSVEVTYETSNMLRVKVRG